ncbi:MULTISPECIES: hypothetical protein [Nocardia]|uniref:hypothetical protein n=1 Tax=Nocardia TaxID=1817 RepID=UPI000BF02CD9|nr:MULTISPECIES: hypothetical protein [Nocardia]MBF6071400.1 hypothetical protein [Nocardia farcinica]MBF6185412.1 hypothetical protein [Nocardia farcinica]MBF6257159.1 hypothetical protein [Nocardia farcinica]MBF6311247.1 hypothetical protein [Nocardia farcinica]MBF6407868.1 hypothetical protein [Nocardia farcinica]
MKLSTTVLATAGLLLGGTLAVELLGGSESTAAPAGSPAAVHSCTAAVPDPQAAATQRFGSVVAVGLTRAR